MMMVVFDGATGGMAVQDNVVLTRSQRPSVRRCLTEKEVASYIGMSRSFLRQARMHGKRRNRTPGPPFIKIGRKVLYLEDDLDAWLEAHRQAEG